VFGSAGLLFLEAGIGEASNRCGSGRALHFAGRR
jgi:hypothetical protein